jgi:hypothetical protein
MYNGRYTPARLSRTAEIENYYNAVDVMMF